MYSRSVKCSVITSPIRPPTLRNITSSNVELTYLLMPVYSLGAWAIDQSSPPDPALRHGCNFLPGVPHLPRFRLHVSPPGVSWPSSFPLPLGIPCQCLSCDASCRFSQRVTNPTPFSSFYFYFYWQLICLGPQSVVADFV